MLDYLTDSYVRRKRYEAKLLAIEIWTLFGEAMQGGKVESSIGDLAKSGFGVRRGDSG